MSTVIKCDRCGCPTRGGLWVDVGDSIDGYDLCRDCARQLVEWIKSGAGELVFSDGCRDPEVTGGWPDEYANDALPPESDASADVDAANDTREKLEEDVRSHFWHQDWCRVGIVIGWLDRQAAITEREFFESACQGCERLGGEDDATLAEMAQRIQVLELEARKGEEYRAKLGAVLDALHEAVRVAR